MNALGGRSIQFRTIKIIEQKLLRLNVKIFFASKVYLIKPIVSVPFKTTIADEYKKRFSGKSEWHLKISEKLSESWFEQSSKNSSKNVLPQIFGSGTAIWHNV